MTITHALISSINGLLISSEIGTVKCNEPARTALASLDRSSSDDESGAEEESGNSREELHACRAKGFSDGKYKDGMRSSAITYERRVASRFSDSPSRYRLVQYIVNI